MTESTIESTIEVVVDSTEEVPVRVLHVDDEAGFLKVAKQCLEMQGAFQVETASSVDEALKKMKKKTFDAIVSDYQMPEKDGLEFLKELRGKGNTVSFIMFTGRGREEVAIRALNLGADQYLNKTGDPETVYGELAHAISKIVKAKQDEERVRTSEEKYRSLFENSKDVTLTLDLKGNITSINKAATKYGFKKDKVVGENIRKFAPKRYWPGLFRDLVQLARGKPVKGNIEMVTQKGKKTAEYNSNPIIINNRVVGVQSILKDVTERKKIEKELRMKEATISASQNAIGIADLEGNLIYVNDSFLRLYGYDNESEALGKYGASFWTPAEEAQKAITELRKNGNWRGELLARKKDESVANILLSASVVADETGKPLCLMASGTDITKRKKAEQALQDAKEKWVSLTENTDDIILIVDGKGVIQYINRTIPPYTPEETIGKLVYDYVPREQHDVMKESLRKVFKTGKPDSFEVSSNIPKIGPIWFSVKVVPVRHDKEIPHVVMISTDITERRKAEEELKNSEERLKILFEFAPDAYYLNDLKGNFVDGNKAAEDLTGYNRSELVGKSFLKLKLLPRKQIMKATALLVKNALGKPTGPDEFVLNRKDGTPVSVEIRTFPIKIKNQTLVLGIARDISERKRIEAALKTMNEKLRVVGRLTRHDVRNKLSGITGNVFLAKRKLTGDHKAVEYLREIESATSQIERIFDFARTYEKLSMEKPVYINVEKSLKEAVMQFSDLHSVRMINDCHGLTVLADSLLRQLFYNLIHNSLRHGEKVVQIRVHYEEVGKDR